MSSRLPRGLLTRTLVARLEEIQHLTVYLRRVGFVLDAAAEIPPPTISPDDMRVRPYAVIYPSPGSDGPDERLDQTLTGIVWRPQVTLVAGDETALDLVVDAVTQRLDSWRPTFSAPHDDIEVGRLRKPPGFDPGPSRRDDDIAPARYWTPLQYVLPVYA